MNYRIAGLITTSFLLIILVGCVEPIGGSELSSDGELPDSPKSRIPENEIQQPEIVQPVHVNQSNLSRMDGAVRVGFGTLCSGERECVDFCRNNQERCENYCSNRPDNELCFLVVVSKEDSQEPLDAKPVLQNLGVTIEPLNKATNRAGDFLFERKKYVDNKVFTEFGHKVVNSNGEKLLPEIGLYVPVGTIVVSPLDGVVIDTKLYEPSQDYMIMLKSHESSPWIVGFEHVGNLRVKAGDRVIAGQELAQVSAAYGNNQHGLLELNVWQGGQQIMKYCPFDFLDESLKVTYGNKIKRLAQDWEGFIGKDVYDEDKWVAPGCLVESMVE